jgi:hypothetical protein
MRERIRVPVVNDSLDPSFDSREKGGAFPAFTTKGPMAFANLPSPRAEALAERGDEQCRLGRLPPSVWPRSDWDRDINAGFFLPTLKVLGRIAGNETIWEQGPLRGLAADGQWMAYEHHGFWPPMDTLRDRHHSETLWDGHQATWRVW